jgi:hypothetical protein
MRTLFWILFSLLVLVRVPSLVQPAGGDQGLYAYVGERILAGEVPYRDAWDQKPPGIHYTYALLYALHPDLSIVPAADLLVAAATALLLLALGRRLGPPGSGELAAVLFLFYTNPALARLGGARVRAQCEVFIGLFAAAGLLLAHRAAARLAAANAHVADGPHGIGLTPLAATGLGFTRGRAGRRGPGVATLAFALAAGLCFGLAFAYKYNAGIYLVVGLAALLLWTRRPAAATDAKADATMRLTDLLPPALWMIVGFAAMVALLVGYFAAVGALRDLYDATIAYNVFYSGETYASRFDVPRYLFTFPIGRARVEAIWFLGGLGCLTLIAASWRRPARLVPVLWVAAACVSIAVNGSRGLPQYFLQAGPALALAAGIAGMIAWHHTKPVVRLVLIVIIAIAALRVQDFNKGIDYTAYDLRYWRGALTREQYLSRFGDLTAGDKYSALAVEELAHYLQANVPPQERVLHFGFSQGALAQARRVSATRFFWSRPIIVGFKEGTPGYGVAGLLQELARTTPYEVVLQRRDWDPDTLDSATYFLQQPALSAWLRAHYEPAREMGNFLLYRRANAQAAP